jgi:hypothetical protein
MTRLAMKPRNMYDSQKNDRSTIEGKRRIPSIVINCGTIQMLN